MALSIPNSDSSMANLREKEKRGWGIRKIVLTPKVLHDLDLHYTLRSIAVKYIYYGMAGLSVSAIGPTSQTLSPNPCEDAGFRGKGCRPRAPVFGVLGLG